MRVAAVVFPFVPRGKGFAGQISIAGLRRVFHQYSACKSILVGVYHGHLLLGATVETIEQQLQTMYAYTGDDEATAARYRAWIERGLEIFFKCERAILQTAGRPVRVAARPRWDRSHRARISKYWSMPGTRRQAVVWVRSQ